MDKQELQKYIDLNYTYRQLAQQFNVSPSTVRHWMKKYGLKTNNKQYNNSARYEFRGCKNCGESDSKKFYKKKGRNCGTFVKLVIKLLMANNG